MAERWRAIGMVEGNAVEMLNYYVKPNMEECELYSRIERILYIIKLFT